MRTAVKQALNLASQLLMLPLAIPCWAEDRLSDGRSETLFNICTQAVALLPGLPGVFLRRAFYALTLERCSLESHIGFGTVVSHRQCCIGHHVYIGSYALIGSADIGEHSLLGSRVSILSGEALHVLEKDKGRWSPFKPERLQRIRIGSNCWIGEGAIIVAAIGEGCMVGAGSVITSEVRAGVMVAGNPARFVKTLVEKP
ncbi:MAG: acyltransferase [Pseudohaliea sp.]